MSAFDRFWLMRNKFEHFISYKKCKNVHRLVRVSNASIAIANQPDLLFGAVQPKSENVIVNNKTKMRIPA